MPPRNAATLPKAGPVTVRRIHAKGPDRPSRHLQTEQLLDAMGFQWALRYDVGIEEIDEQASLHNQARVSKPLIAETLARYTAFLERGDVFPALIAAEYGKEHPLQLVDGNHRFAAMKQRGFDQVDVYVIVNGNPNAIAMLTMTINTRHGQASSEEDRIHAGLYLVDNGVSVKDAAGQVGVSTGKLQSAQNQQAANRRARNAGISMQRWDKLPPSVRGRLGQTHDNHGFAHLTQLVFDTGMRDATEIGKWVSMANAARGTSEALEVVKALRSTLTQELQTGGASATRKTVGRQVETPRMQWAKAMLSYKQLPEPQAVVERMTPAERDAMIPEVEAMLKKIAMLREALSQQ